MAFSPNYATQLISRDLFKSEFHQQNISSKIFDRYCSCDKDQAQVYNNITKTKELSTYESKLSNLNANIDSLFWQ